MTFSSSVGGTAVRKTASITIVEEPDDFESLSEQARLQQLLPPENTITTSATTTTVTATATTTAVTETTEQTIAIDNATGAARPRDYYNSGSTEDATDTPLVINRLEAVRSLRYQHAKS
jgi:hypothetical protein